MDSKGPTILTDAHMFPGMEVERHLRMYGHLPEHGCCEHDQVADIDFLEPYVVKDTYLPGGGRTHKKKIKRKKRVKPASYRKK